MSMSIPIPTPTPMPDTFSFQQALLHLHPQDTVAVVKIDLGAGTLIVPQNGQEAPAQIRVRQDIPAGHKIALSALLPGDAVLKYGQFIGSATQPVQPGEWVHSHNLTLPSEKRSFAYELTIPANPVQAMPARTFLGYPRREGGAGTRNFVAVIATVSCAAQTARLIAAHFTRHKLTAFPNVDGVVAVTHHSGCGFAPHTDSFRYLQSTIANLVQNPNLGGALLVGLGCEISGLETCLPPIEAARGSLVGIPSLVIQEQGGIAQTVSAGIAALEELLPQVNRVSRVPLPASMLKVALQCGGSDAWSGITANPLVGSLSDALVASGGTVVLGETPEIFGAEFLLLSRSASSQIAEQLRHILDSWQRMAEQYGFSIDNNPTPGNKAGGLTTIYEKSLGAVIKGGSSPLRAAYRYAEKIEQPGLVFMDTPGNDLTSLTGMAAGGCNLALFTTGRGTVATGILVPCIKIATNSRLYARMPGDMDINAGDLLEGVPLAEKTSSLFDSVLAVASGEKTCGEAWDMREAEFVPWQPGCAL